MKVCNAKALLLRLFILKFLSSSVGCPTDEVLPFDQVSKPLHDAEKYLPDTFRKDAEASTSSYNLGSGPPHTNSPLLPSSSLLSKESRHGTGYFSPNPANFPQAKRPAYHVPQVMRWKLVVVPVPIGGMKSTNPEAVDFPYTERLAYYVPEVVSWKPIVGKVGQPMFEKPSVLSSNAPPFVPTGRFKSAFPDDKPPATPQAHRTERKMQETLAESNESHKDQRSKDATSNMMAHVKNDLNNLCQPTQASQSSQATEGKDHNSSEKLKAGAKMNDKQYLFIDPNSHDFARPQSPDPKEKIFVKDTNSVVTTSEHKKPNRTYFSKPTNLRTKEPKKINGPQKTEPPHAEGGKNIENNFSAPSSLLEDDSDGLKIGNTEERELEKSDNNIDIIKYDEHSPKSLGTTEKTNNEASDGLIPSNGKKRFNSGSIETGSSSGDPAKEAESAEKQTNHDPVNRNNEVKHADQSQSRRLKAETQISSQVITGKHESVSPNEAEREKKSHQTETNFPIESVTETSSSNNKSALRNAVDSKLDFEKDSQSDSKDKTTISDDLKDRLDRCKADQNQVMNTKQVTQPVKTRTVISSGNRKEKTHLPPSSWEAQRVNHGNDLLQKEPGSKKKDSPNLTERRKTPNQSQVKKSAQEVPGIGQLEPKSVTERNLSEEIAQIINNGLKRGFERKAKDRQTHIIEKLTEAFDPVCTHDPSQKLGHFSTDKLASAMSECKEFYTQTQLEFFRNSQIITVNEAKLWSNVAELLGKHLKAENIKAYELLPDMDHTLFKKLQLAWYINHDKFIRITSSLEIEKGKHERMLTLAKQIAQHTFVENYETLESYYRTNNRQNQLNQLRYLKEDFMLTTQFPCLTDYSERRFTPSPEVLALSPLNQEMLHILKLVLGIEEFKNRLKIREVIDKLGDEIPLPLKSEILKDYYKHTDLDLASTAQAYLLLSSLPDKYLLAEKGSVMMIEIMEMSVLSRGKKIGEIPWHESSNRRYLIETLGENYDEALHEACTLMEPYQDSNEEILGHSKAAKVNELAIILDKRSSDLIRFTDIGFDLNCIQVLMLLKLNGKMQDESKELVWDSFEKKLSIKLSENQKSYIESWFDANVQLKKKE